MTAQHSFSILLWSSSPIEAVKIILMIEKELDMIVGVPNLEELFMLAFHMVSHKVFERALLGHIFPVDNT